MKAPTLMIPIPTVTEHKMEMMTSHWTQMRIPIPTEME